MKLIIIALSALLITSCTVVRYQSEERTLTVIDLHPGGESLSLSGAIESIGTLDVNRESGSSAQIVSDAVDAATGIPRL